MSANCLKAYQSIITGARRMDCFPPAKPSPLAMLIRGEFNRNWLVPRNSDSIPPGKLPRRLARLTEGFKGGRAPLRPRRPVARGPRADMAVRPQARQVPAKVCCGPAGGGRVGFGSHGVLILSVVVPAISPEGPRAGLPSAAVWIWPSRAACIPPISARSATRPAGRPGASSLKNVKGLPAPVERPHF